MTDREMEEAIDKGWSFTKGFCWGVAGASAFWIVICWMMWRTS